MSKLFEIRCHAIDVKFYDGKGHLAVVNDGEVTAYGASVNGKVTALDGDPIHGFATAFIEPAVWNTVVSGKPVIGTDVVVLAVCEDRGVKPGVRKEYHDLEVKQVLEVSVVDMLTPKDREIIAGRGIAGTKIPRVTKIGERKVAKM